MFSDIFCPFPPPYDIVDGIIYKVLQKGEEWKFYTKRFKILQRLMDGIWSLGFESKFSLPFEAIVDSYCHRLVAQPLLPCGDYTRNVLQNLTSPTQVSNMYLKLDIAEQLMALAEVINLDFWPSVSPPPILFIDGYFYIMDVPKDASKGTIDIAIPHFLNFCRDIWDVRFLRKELNVSKQGIKMSLDSNILFPDVTYLIGQKNTGADDVNSQSNEKDALSMEYKVKTLYPRRTWLLETSVKLIMRYTSFDQSRYMRGVTGIKLGDALANTAMLWQSQSYTYGPLGRVRSAFTKNGHPCDPICPMNAHGVCINYQGQIQAAQLYQSVVEALKIDQVWSDKVKLWINHLHINHYKYDLIEPLTSEYMFYGDYGNATDDYDGVVAHMEGKLGRNGFWKLQLDLLMSINKSGVDINSGNLDFANDSDEFIVYAKRAYDLSFSTFTNKDIDWALVASVMLYSTYLFYGKKYGDAIKILTSVIRSSAFDPAILIHLNLLLVQCHFKDGNYQIGSRIAEESLKSYSNDVSGPKIIFKLTFLMALMRSRMGRQDKIAALDIFQSLYHQLKLLHPEFLTKTLLLIREVLQLKLDLCTEHDLKNLRILLRQTGSYTLQNISQSVEHDIDTLCREILDECEANNLSPIEWIDRNLLWGKILQISPMGHSEIHVTQSLRVLRLFKTPRIENALIQCD